MKELKPLLRDDASAFERQLLNAVRRERPSPQLQARMRGTLGLTGPVAWLGAARAALSSVAGKSALGVGIVGLVAGGLVATGVVGGGETSVTGPVAEVAAVQAASPEAASPEAVSPEAVTAAEPSAPPAAPAVDSEDPGDRQLREEILLLDGARSALQRGSRAAALRELDRYRERFPAGILSREAAQLRQQARVKGPASGSR